MRDPRRLIERGDGETADLLRAAMADGPSRRSERAAAAALGIAVVGASSATAGAAGAAGTVGASGAAAMAAGSGGAMVTAGGALAFLGKIVVVASIVSATAVVAFKETSPAPSTIANTSPSAIALPTPRRVPAPPIAPMEPDRAPTAGASELPEAQQPSAVTAPARRPPAAVSPRRPLAEPPAVAPDPPQPAARISSSLRAETTELDAARDTLALGDVPGALRALDTYARDFSDGLLAPEAALLRIEALARSGDREGAKRLAEGFVLSYPHSPLAARALTFVTPRTNP